MRPGPGVHPSGDARRGEVPHVRTTQHPPGPQGAQGHRTRGATGRRGRPGAGLAQAQLRQGTVPGALPARPDPSASPAAARRHPARRGVPGTAAHLLRDARRQRADRARGEDPRRGDRRSQGARRPRDEDRDQVRRARPHPGVLQQGARPRRLGQPRDRRAALRASVDRRTAAPEDLRYPGAEGRLPAPAGHHRHLRLPADRTGRRFRPGPPRHLRGARRAGLRPRRREALDHQRRRRRPPGRHGPGPRVRGPSRRHHRVRRRGRRPRRHRRAPQRLHGPARHRERRHPLPPGASARRLPDRARGPA